MQNKLCIHCFVEGRVQGVWFRAGTEKEAVRLGLTGWVRNCPDGRVEVLACGTQEACDALYLWLHQGPPLAKVTAVTREALPWAVHHAFVQRRHPDD